MDGRQTVPSAIAENSMIHANFTAYLLWNRSTFEVLHCAAKIRNFAHFCRYEIDLDPVTLIGLYELDPYVLKMY